jgi:hypothetical protein
MFNSQHSLPPCNVHYYDRHSMTTDNSNRRPEYNLKMERYGLQTTRLCFMFSIIYATRHKVLHTIGVSVFSLSLLTVV